MLMLKLMFSVLMKHAEESTAVTKKSNNLDLVFDTKYSSLIC